MTIYARPKLENAIFSNFQGASSWESMYESLWKSKILHAIDQKKKNCSYFEFAFLPKNLAKSYNGFTHMTLGGNNNRQKIYFYKNVKFS